jgi:outer membrane usher protein
LNKSKIIFTTFLLFCFSAIGYGQTIIEDDLHEKVFGKRKKVEIIDVDFFAEGASLGAVKVKVLGDKLISIEKNSLVQVLNEKLESGELYKISSLTDGWVLPEQVGFPLRYSPEVLGIISKIPLEKMTAKERLVKEIAENKNRAITPAPVSGAVTARAEQYWADDRLGGNYFLGHADSFVNMKGVVLENQSVYQSNLNNRWFRGDTRLVKDFNESMIRTQAGDINYQTIGFQTLRPIGGVSVGRNFFLNPYRTPYPKFNKDFVVKTRSKVTYFVNGNLIKSEFLAPGRYAVRDVPLVNGINNIVVEIEDDLGRKEVINFQQTTSINLLNNGESKFDLSVGYPFQDINQKREYEKDNVLTSGFYQHGLTDYFTAAAYAQNYDRFNLGGIETILATSIGNFSLGGAYGGDNTNSGSVYSLGYNLAIVRTEWFSAHNLNIRHEIRESDFIQTWGSAPSRIKNLSSVNYSLPLFKMLTLGIGGNYGQKNKYGEVDKYGYDTSLTVRLFQNVNATFYAARNRDEFRNTNDLAYMLINITFPEKSQFVTAYADTTNQTRRITYVKDNLNELNSFKGQASVETNKMANVGDADLVFNAKLADLGVHATGFNYEDSGGSAGRYSARLNSSFVFAASNEGWSWAVSRPVQTSFALLAPNEHLQDQKFGVKSTSPFSEGLSDFMGKTVFVNLLPYQYREIQLDPSNIDIGHSLGQENYVLFPTYRSGHLIFVGAPGKVTVRGKLISPSGIEGLRTGEIIGEGVSSMFFTNRKGQFLIENLMPGTYKLKTDDEREVEFTIPEKTKGLFEIGNLEIAPWEE